MTRSSSSSVDAVKEKCGVAAGLALAMSAFLLIAGCGSNLSEVLSQTIDATGRTFLDQFITDAVNGVADAFNGQPSQGLGNQNDNTSAGGNTNQNANANQNDNSSANQNGNTGGGLGDLTGDPTAGAALYMMSCASCHCGDAVGGCLLDAPALRNVDSRTISDFIRGDSTHPIKRDLSDQNIVDLEAFLATLGG